MSAWYRPLVEDAAEAASLDPDLVDALIRVESNGNQWAWNAEPRYRYFWNVKTGKPFRKVTFEEMASEIPPDDFPTLAGDPDQEWWAQQASWGLMQIMGAVARELGFRGLYLPQLCSAQTNIEVGCKKLKAELTWARGDVRMALMAYNGGRGNAMKQAPPVQVYARKVLDQLSKVKAA